jgi:peptidoglycan/LPS O-acetylase OafA/YrhL
MPGLTGLRGVAVASVIAYHLGYLKGGFVGVDVFFVLSGFLITTLLLRDTPRRPRDLATWWSRRFTRLTPAVAVVVLAVLIAFATMSGIALDGLATLTWWQNWHLIIEGTPYWAGSPSPLRHAWSLSIEEQFYAVWPPVLLGCLVLARRVRARRPQVAVGLLALGLSVTSFGWAAYLALGEHASLSRIYFGTDTRAGALLIGCAAAAALHGRTLPRATARWTGAAAVAGAGLVALSLTLAPDLRWSYTGGLLLAALSALVVVLVSARPGPLSDALSWAPLQWLGVRSYALYLWSWPVQVLVQDRAPSLPLVAVAAITVVASLLLSSLSLRWVEEPLRRANGWARRLRPRRAAWMAGVALLALAMVFAANSTELTVDETVAQEFEKLPDPTTTTTTCPPPPPTVPVPAFTEEITEFDPSTVTRSLDPTAPTCGEPPTRVLVVGDSTARGAANGLRRLAPADLEIWDRSELGCGLETPKDDCPDWRTAWPAAVAQVQPDVVLVYVRTSDDLVPEDDPPFLSDEDGALRQSEMTTATQLLSAGGAKVVWVLPAVPLERGSFYCDGRRTDSPCDPAWVARWRDDVAAVAAQQGAGTVDVQAWIDARPAETATADRPDGLHFSGTALDQHAAWLADQLRAVPLTTP